MYITKTLSEHRNDFTAELTCEHCAHKGTLKSGYHDEFYHNNVIPSIICKNCGLNRDGTKTPRQNVNGVQTI